MTAPQGLSCPGCEQPPMFLFGGGWQAFCGNTTCHVATWNPTMTLAELQADFTYIDIPDRAEPT